MNEPGMPARLNDVSRSGGPAMPPANLPTANPPSYLRPPKVSAHRPSSGLTFSTGILALIVIVAGGWYYYSSFDFTPPLTGSLVYAEQGNLNQFIFETSTSSPFGTLVTSLPSDPTTLLATQALFVSADANTFLQSTVDKNKVSRLILKSRDDNQGDIITVGKEGEPFTSPVISSDKKQVAYLSIDTLTSTTTVVNGVKVNLLKPALIWLDLSAQNPVTKQFSNFGTPFAFAPDGTKLLLRQGAKLALITRDSTTASLITGTPTVENGSGMVAAISSDGQLLALSTLAGISVGKFDWSNGSFTQVLIIPKSAGKLIFAANGDLAALIGNDIYAFRIDGNQAREIGHSSFELSTGVRLLTWIPSS